METYLGRFLRYEYAYVTLIPVDPNEPRLGGKVKAQAFTMDFRTLTPSFNTLYGVYSDDFITFGDYSKDNSNPLSNDETLIKICDDTDSKTVPKKTTFRF